MSAGGTLVEAALAYLGLGWSVVPMHTPTAGVCSCGREDCPSPGKHPRIAWEPLMRHRPEPDRVVGWWRRWPDANVAVVTGVVSGVAVLDVDPRGGGEAALADLERRETALPATVGSVTGGGGRHRWFSPEGVRIASRVLAPGLELKAEGSTVVAPPSVHATGRRYAWESDRAPWQMRLAPLPGPIAGDATAIEERGPGHPPDAPVRTTAEQREFAEAWREVGVELLPGDRYYLCPFHDDHHPSLHVDAHGCRWYCFGCGRGGGIGRLRHLIGGPDAARRRARIGGEIPDGEVTLHGDVEVPVVGEGRHQDELLSLTGGHRHYGGARVRAVAELAPEPDNRFDPDAIAVSIAGLQVGYLRHADAVAYRDPVLRAIERAGSAGCRAEIRGGWDRGRGDVGAFGVVLRLPAHRAPTAPA